VAVRYVYNPFSAEIEPLNEPIREEEFYDVDLALEASKTIVVNYIVKQKSERILVNGVELSKGATKDYTLTNNTIVFNNGVLTNGDSIKINYLRRF
jgi:hypothetical protein